MEIKCSEIPTIFNEINIAIITNIIFLFIKFIKISKYDAQWFKYFLIYVCCIKNRDN